MILVRPLLMGLVAFATFLMAGSLTGNPIAGWAAAALFAAAITFFWCRATGLLWPALVGLNLPSWLILFFLTVPGQFRLHLPGLLFLLLSSGAGAVAGSWRVRKSAQP